MCFVCFGCFYIPVYGPTHETYDLMISLECSSSLPHFSHLLWATVRRCLYILIDLYSWTLPKDEVIQKSKMLSLSIMWGKQWNKKFNSLCLEIVEVKWFEGLILLNIESSKLWIVKLVSHQTQDSANFCAELHVSPATVFMMWVLASVCFHVPNNSLS